jgi:DNA replication and repair protein RecF
VDLAFAPGLNLITGPNGSGKTSLLEGIFLPGRGRSFRTRQTEQLIARGADHLLVFAQTQSPVHRIGFEYRRNESYVARIDGEDIQTLAQLPTAFFVEVIDPDVHRLVEGGPGERRRWLDWGVFHVEHGFLEHWLRYTRALRQRNAALRTGLDPTPWDGELIAQGNVLTTLRRTWFESLLPHLSQAIGQLCGLSVETGYYQGWAADRELSEVMAANLPRDQERGTTQSGPHRADVVLRVSGKAARETLSRGQQKLVASAMVLALLQRLRSSQATPPTLLLDDPAAELDRSRLGQLVEFVKALKCQVIMTSLDPQPSQFGQPERVFHVEHGKVSAIWR